MSNNRRIICILLISVFCFMCTGCFQMFFGSQSSGAPSSVTPADESIKWREQAEKLAVQHIEEKYGFTPDVIDSQSNRESDLFSSDESPETLVTLSYNDTKFTVIAYGDASSTDDVKDDYQSEEIHQAFEQYMCEYLGISGCDVQLQAGRVLYLYADELITKYNYFHDLYDGTNLEELLTQNSITAYVKVTEDIDIDEIVSSQNDSMLFHQRMDLLITTHDSSGDADKCCLLTYFDDTVYSHAIYIKDAIDIRSGKIRTYELSVGQYDDFYYLCTGTDASECIFETRIDSVSDTEWGSEVYAYEPVGNEAYYLSDIINSDSELFIFYPEENLPTISSDNSTIRLGAAYRVIEYDKYRYDETEAIAIDGYRVFSLDMMNRDNISLRLLIGNES